MEMPVDILNRELGAIRDNGDIDFDNTMAAVNIDTILQEKFIFIPKAEVDAVEVRDTHVVGPYDLQAGDGPETCRANRGDNPAWLYNSAVHALALMQHIKLEQERPRIPEPGVYLVTTKASGHAHAAIVTEDRRVVVPQTGLGTMADKTFVFRSSESEFVWQRIDCATGDIV